MRFGANRQFNMRSNDLLGSLLPLLLQKMAMMRQTPPADTPIQANIPAPPMDSGVHVSNPMGTFNPRPPNSMTQAMPSYSTPSVEAHRQRMRARIQKFLPTPKPKMDVGAAGMMAGRPEPAPVGTRGRYSEYADQSREARQDTVAKGKQANTDWKVAYEMYKAAETDAERERWMKRMQEANEAAKAWLA